MKSSWAHQLFERFEQKTPQPKTELIYSSTFELLVAVILSAQCTDKAVNIATKALFAIAPSAQAMLALGEETLISYIRKIGLYRTKAKHIISTCQILCQTHNGNVPSTRDELESLPGVGRKTANVILNTAFGEPTIAVDTHIFRVSRRIGLSTGATPLAVEKDLLAIIPPAFKLNAHHWLILHGRYTCTARQPKCSRCMVADLCKHPQE